MVIGSVAAVAAGQMTLDVDVAAVTRLRDHEDSVLASAGMLGSR